MELDNLPGDSRCLLQCENLLSRQREGIITPENINVKKSTVRTSWILFIFGLNSAIFKIGLVSLCLENRNQAHSTCASWLSEKFIAVLRVGQQARKSTYLFLNFCVECFFFFQHLNLV